MSSIHGLHGPTKQPLRRGEDGGPSVAWLLLALVVILGLLPRTGRATESTMDALPVTEAVRFLDREAGRAALLDDSAEPYFEKLQPREMAIKTGRELPVASRADQLRFVRAAYRSAVLDFTPAERDCLRWYLGKLRPHLQAHYPALDAPGWTFLKTDGSIECGFPHTRGRAIILSRGYLAAMAMMRQRSQAGALGSFGLTLIHEQIHVLQRLDPEPWRELYREVFGMVRAERIAPNDWLIAHQLLNPDGTELRWLWPLPVEGRGREALLPLLIASDEARRMGAPKGMRMVGVRVVEDRRAPGRYAVVAEAPGSSRPAFEALTRFRDYVAAFAPSANIYHPNETSADLLAKWIRLEMRGDEAALQERSRRYPIHGALRDWAREALATPSPALVPAPNPTTLPTAAARSGSLRSAPARACMALHPAAAAPTEEETP